MREPISWLGSWYRYRRRPFLNGKPTSTAGISFEDFVLAYIAPEQAPFANVGSQFRFLEPRPNGTQVDHLFAYENQEPLIEFLQQRLNQTLRIPVTNMSPGADLSLTPGTEDRLRRKYARDFALYDCIVR